MDTMKHALPMFAAALLLTSCQMATAPSPIEVHAIVTPAKAGTSIRLSNLRAEVRDGVLHVSAQVGARPGWRTICLVDDGEPHGYFGRWDAEFDVQPYQGWCLTHWNQTRSECSDVLCPANVTATPHAVDFSAPLSGLSESGTVVVGVGYFELDDYTQITCTYGPKKQGPPAGLPDSPETKP
jgi:hypothetical protein